MIGDASLHATLPADDLERAKAWYADKLDLNPQEEDEASGAWYEVGGVPFLLYVSEYAGTNRATAASIAVDDSDAALAGLRGRGVVFEDLEMGEFKTEDGVLTLPDGRKAAWFKDSEGNTPAITRMQPSIGGIAREMGRLGVFRGPSRR